MATSRRELEYKIYELEASINSERLHFVKILALHIVGLRLMLSILPPSNFHCKHVWMLGALVMLVRVPFSVSFMRCVLRLVDLHAELNAAKRSAGWDGEEGLRRRDRRKVYAILAVVCLSAISDVVIVGCLTLACQHA